MNLLAYGCTLPDMPWLAFRPILFGVAIIGTSCGVIVTVTTYLARATERSDPTEHRPRRATPSAPYAQLSLSKSHRRGVG
ncbi:MAG: hypothetical protein JWN24_733 [Phycisphaerales bacterium]|nr:hypothetical protein [Phycisphaerales bacterium]